MKFAEASIAVAATLGIALIVVLGWLFFSPATALALLALAAVSVLRPECGLALLFLAAPLDMARPVSGVIVSLSELEFAAVVLAWLGRPAEGRPGIARRLADTDWRSLLWSVPFLAAVALSSLVNIAGFKVIPHLLRASEMSVALWLASSVFGRLGRQWLRMAVGAAAILYVGLGLGDVAAHLPQVVSAFSNSNQFAGYLLIVLAPLAMFSLRAGGPSRWLWRSLTMISLAALVLTGSRAATAAAFFSMAYLWHAVASEASKPRWATMRWTFAAGGVVLALVVLAASLSPGRLDATAGKGGRPAFEYSWNQISTTWSHRLALFRMAKTIWANHPVLGIGPGRYDDVYPRYASIVEEPRRLLFESQERERSGPKTVEARVDRRMEAFRSKAATHVHNLFLQLAVDFGIVGVAGFLTWTVLLYRRLSAGGSGTWSVTGRVILLSFLLHNLLDVTWPSLGLELGILLGACAAVGGHAVEGKIPVADAPRLRRSGGWGRRATKATPAVQGRSLQVAERD